MLTKLSSGEHQFTATTVEERYISQHLRGSVGTPLSGNITDWAENVPEIFVIYNHSSLGSLPAGTIILNAQDFVPNVHNFFHVKNLGSGVWLLQIIVNQPPEIDPNTCEISGGSTNATAEVGQVLTINYDQTDAENDPATTPLVEWYRFDTLPSYPINYASGVLIAGASAVSYTTQTADNNKHLVARLKARASAGTTENPNWVSTTNPLLVSNFSANYYPNSLNLTDADADNIPEAGGTEFTLVGSPAPTFDTLSNSQANGFTGRAFRIRANTNGTDIAVTFQDGATSPIAGASKLTVGEVYEFVVEYRASFAFASGSRFVQFRGGGSANISPTQTNYGPNTGQAIRITVEGTWTGQNNNFQVRLVNPQTNVDVNLSDWLEVCLISVRKKN